MVRECVRALCICAVYNVHMYVHCIQYTLYSVQCTNACTVHCIHCTLYTVYACECALLNTGNNVLNFALRSAKALSSRKENNSVQAGQIRDIRRVSYAGRDGIKTY